MLERNIKKNCIRYVVNFIIVLALSMSVLAAFRTDVYAATKGQARIKCSDDSSVSARSGPGTTYELMNKLQNNTKITIVESVKSDAGETWYKISYTSSSGEEVVSYVRSDFVSQYDSSVDSSEETSEAVEEEEEELDPNDPYQFKYGKKVLRYQANIPSNVIPRDFVLKSMVLSEASYNVLVYCENALPLLYLGDKDGNNCKLYVYDPANDRVYPFVMIQSGDRYIIPVYTDFANGPVKSKEVTLSLADEVPFYAGEVDGLDFYLVYAFNDQATAGWYLYDKENTSYVKYCDSDIFYEDDEEANDDSYSEDDGDVADVWEDTANVSSDKRLIIVRVVTVIMFVVIIIVIAVAFFTYSTTRKADDNENDDDGNDVRHGRADASRKKYNNKSISRPANRPANRTVNRPANRPVSKRTNVSNDENPVNFDFDMEIDFDETDGNK